MLRGRSGLPEDRSGDHPTISAGAGRNVAGLIVFVLASLGINVLIAHGEGPRSLGTITLAVQLAFVGAAGTKVGIDLAAARKVALDVNRGKPGRARVVVDRAVAIAAVVSSVVALAIFEGAGRIAGWLDVREPAVFRAAAIALPFVALCQVCLGGSRGLKIIRHTVTVCWVGQPVLWIAIWSLDWIFEKSRDGQIGVPFTVWAYAASWFLMTCWALYLWRKATRAFDHVPVDPAETEELMRYGVPRAPAALLAQALLWTDYFVASRFVSPGELGVYAAAVRVAQVIALLLVVVNHLFGSFVAELHERGDRDKLDSLCKALTRWTLAASLPLLLLFAIVPGPVLALFGAGFDTGTTPLRILLVGQLASVAVGGVGLILLLADRARWDLTAYGGSFLLDVLVALALVPHFGARGAAVAQTLTLVVANGVRLYLLWRFVHIQPFDRALLRLTIPGGASALVMILVHLVLRDSGWPVDLTGTAAVGGFLYLAMMLIAGLTPTERGSLMRVLGRAV